MKMLSTPRRPGRKQAGFTLPMTMMLVIVLTVLATAIMARIYTGIKQEGFDKEHQYTSDAAVIGLNMAIDEISPGIDRMKNAVWSASTMSITAPDPRIQYASDSVMAMLDGTTLSPTSEPARELALLGNIRNWDAFADWSQVPLDNSWSNLQGWAKSWKYVPRSGAIQYFDDVTGGTAATISVGTAPTTGNYWYSQISPLPPANVAGVNYGTGTVPSDAPQAPRAWPNARNGTVYGNEYPNGLFDQPVLRKIYQVRPNVRVAVYVRLELQDYFGGSNNHNPDGWFFTTPASPTFNAANFYNSNAVTFSIFAVSESTPTTRGVRISQALNVAVGGAEYFSGDGAGEANTLNGLENPWRLNSQDSSPPTYYSGPYFAPVFDSPAGNNTLVAFTPVTGQVYPASCDLSFSPLTRAATEQVVFLYERIQLPAPPGWAYAVPAFPQPTVIFMIEQVPTAVSGAAQVYWRRRLVMDYPNGALSNPAFWGTPQNDLTMQFAGASYSIDPWSSPYGLSAAFPSMAWWANLNQATANPPVTFSDMIFPVADHFNAPTFTVGNTTGTRFPFSTTLDRLGKFVPIGTQSATLPAGNAAGDVVVWPNNPLLGYDGNRLPSSMPWQGPAIPTSPSAASVSYYALSWPQYAFSSLWGGSGGGISIPLAAATENIKF